MSNWTNDSVSSTQDICAWDFLQGREIKVNQVCEHQILCSPNICCRSLNKPSFSQQLWGVKTSLPLLSCSMLKGDEALWSEIGNVRPIFKSWSSHVLKDSVGALREIVETQCQTGTKPPLSPSGMPAPPTFCPFYQTYKNSSVWGCTHVCMFVWCCMVPVHQFNPCQCGVPFLAQSFERGRSFLFNCD